MTHNTPQKIEEKFYELIEPEIMDFQIHVREVTGGSRYPSVDSTRLSCACKKALTSLASEVRKEERERINQFFADKADYDTETDCTVITDRVYHEAFHPDETEALQSLAHREDHE